VPTSGFRTFATALATALLLASPAAAQCPDGTPFPCGPPRPALIRIQVLAFQPADSGDAYVASALTEDLATALVGSHAVAIVGPRASAVAADYVLSGRVRREGDGVVVRCRMERRRTGRVVWTTLLSRLGRELPSVAPALAAAALRAIGLQGAPVPPPTETSPGTYDLVTRARYLVSRRTEPAMVRAITLSREAVVRDSTSALAWAGLAHVLERESLLRLRVPGLSADSALAQALSASERAVELAPDDPDVRLFRVQVGQQVEPTDRSASMRAYREILAVAPLNSAAWQQLAMNLLETGDHQQAVAAFARAVALEPENAERLTFLAIGYFESRQYDSAAVLLRRAVAADPTYMLARAIGGQVALWRGRLDEAQAAFEAADRLLLSAEDRPGFLELARVLLLRGDSAGARAYVAAAAAEADTSAPAVHLVIAMADGFLAVGDTTRAYWWFGRYQPRRDAHFQMHLRDEPAFEGLHADPRYRALVAP
jgi:tetratricopeptide (TPR) repeat protein